jgi:hypothetical protein
MKLNRSRVAKIAGAGALALAATMLLAAPANAAGNPTCGSGTYTASHSTTQAVSQQISTNDCSLYYASARYAYNGVTYWTPFHSGDHVATATPGYPVDQGQHYTSYSGVVTG